MKKNSNKSKGIIIIGLASLLSLSLVSRFLSKKKEASLDLQLDLLDEIENEKNDKILVHMTGQVKEPGLLEMEEGRRVADAIEEAGGLTEDADIEDVNLAEKLEDEDKIHIPEIGEDDQEEASSSGQKEGKININRCSQDELCSLPGVGEVLAQRIIDYREESPFKIVEDLMNVSGIGEKKFEDIKELVKVR